MSNRNYDSSLITNRRRNLSVAGSFIRRSQDNSQPMSGYGNSMTGNYDNSVITHVKSGSMTEFFRNGTCVTQNDGCPCGITNTVSVASLLPPVQSGWATNIGGIANESGVGITTDTDGNIYITGVYSSNPITINSFYSTTNGVINVTPFGTLSNVGSNDIYIVKYNSNGIVQWATRIGGSGNDNNNHIVCDSNGNVYVSGRYISNPITINNFDSVSNGIINVTPFGTLSNTSTNRSDIYIVKYNSNGIAQWATNIGGINDDNISDIAIDSNDNIYLSGTFLSSTITVNNFSSVSGGNIIITPYGTLSNNNFVADAFLVKYNSNGIAEWVTNIENVIADKIKITTDSNDNINICVSMTGINSIITVNNFSSVSGGVINVVPYGTISPSNFYKQCIIQYNSNGIAQWATSINTKAIFNVESITTDSSNNIYITISSLFNNPLDYIDLYNFSSVNSGVINLTQYGRIFSNGADIFIFKYNSNGIAQWATKIGGINSEYALSIASDAYNNIYIGGYYASNPITINNFSSVSGGVINVVPYGTLLSSGGFDGFIIKYNSNGNAQWATTISGTSTDVVYGIATNSDGSVYVIGNYNSNPITINNFDSVSNGVINVAPYATLSNTNGSTDTFLVRYNSDGKV